MNKKKHKKMSFWKIVEQKELGKIFSKKVTVGPSRGYSGIFFFFFFVRNNLCNTDASIFNTLKKAYARKLDIVGISLWWVEKKNVVPFKII